MTDTWRTTPEDVVANYLIEEVELSDFEAERHAVELLADLDTDWILVRRSNAMQLPPIADDDDPAPDVAPDPVVLPEQS